MSVLEEYGICRQSGCEAVALDRGSEFLILGRARLFAGIDLSAFALTDRTLLSQFLLPFLADREMRPRLEYLHAQLFNRHHQSVPDEQIAEAFTGGLGRIFVAYRMPKMESGETDFALNTRNPDAREETLLDRMLFVIRLTVERYLSEEFTQQIRSLIDPANILTTAATFVGMAAAAASGVGTAIMASVGFVLKGFEIFEIIRSFLRFFNAFMTDVREEAARILGGALASLGVAVIGLFVRRVGGRIRRPRENLARPSRSDTLDFSDVRHDLGLRSGSPAPQQPHRQHIRGSADDARAAGWIDAAGNPRGPVGAAVAPHRRAADVRAATGHTGATRQSAHVGATSLLRALPGYSRNDALTAQLDPSTHRSFDRHWLDWARQRRRTSTDVPLSEALDAQRRALQQTTGLTQHQKDTLEWILEREFLTLAHGLPSGMATRIPLPNL